MRLRTGGHTIGADGRYHPRTVDQGPARGRVEGSRGGGGLPLAVSTDGFVGNVSVEQRTCSICGTTLGSRKGLASHRSKMHRDAA